MDRTSEVLRRGREGASVARPGLSKEKRDEICEDLRRTHGIPQGSLRNVAERHGVGMTTVRKLRNELGLTEEDARARTKNATEARRADMAEQRARLTQRLLRVAERALDDMENEAIIYNFGGKENTYNQRKVDRPPTVDQRNLATIAAIALDKHRMLDTYDTLNSTASAVDDWLQGVIGRRDQE
jgi:hypothetical protein